MAEYIRVPNVKLVYAFGEVREYFSLDTGSLILLSGKKYLTY